MNFVVFFNLNPRFVITEEGESANEVKERVSSKFGIDQKFLEVVQKKTKKE